MAERCGVSVSSVERDIRYAIAQCWEQMEVRQKRVLLARCASRPAPKLFLAHLLRRLSREIYPAASSDSFRARAAPCEKFPPDTPDGGKRDDR